MSSQTVTNSVQKKIDALDLSMLSKQDQSQVPVTEVCHCVFGP